MSLNELFGGRNGPGSRLESAGIINDEPGRISDVLRNLVELYPCDRDRPTNRLAENARGPPSIHDAVNRGMHACLPERPNRRFKIENESARSNRFRREPPRHGH